MFTAMLFTLAILAVIIFGLLFFMPDLLAELPLAAALGAPAARGNDIATPTLAAVAVVPTPAPTEPLSLLAPTWTPAVDQQQPTPTFVPSPTQGPTAIPTETPILPTRTPTSTATATPTETPTETPVGPPPTPSPTRSPYPFTRADRSPFYLQNYANNAGCQWMGIAGEVLDLNRNPAPVGSYQVHVWGSGIDERLVVGTAPSYSPSGWEQFLFNSPVIRDYMVQLETPNGTPVSEIYRVQSRASCNENLIRFDFVQNH